MNHRTPSLQAWRQWRGAGASKAPRRGIAEKAFTRALIFAALWWVLSEGEATSWGIGAIAVALASAASLMLVPAALPRLKILPLLRFIPFFIARSVQGGIDVARRAFEPVPTLAPAFVSYSLAQMGAAERVVFAMICGLFPGTLSARLDGETLRVHVLDGTMPFMEEFAELEARLAPIFGRAPEPVLLRRKAGGEP
jgi:multicomponent Na+:H+ antiporter subunit E